MTVNVSYIKLNGNVIDNYEQSKKGWKHKKVEWSRLKSVLNNSTIQFSPYQFRNGYKTGNNWSNLMQDMLVFDIDDSMSISEAQRMFSQYKYLIGTTKSHQKLKKGLQCDRYRLSIPAINIPHQEEVYFRMLNLIVPSNDEATNIKTGAFLGNDDAIIIYNDGRTFDCHKAALFVEKQIEMEEAEKVVIDPDLMTSGGSNSSISSIKEELTFEIVVEILESVGYEVIRGKFKIREDESTASATISYKNFGIYDFGSGKRYDIFDILTQYQSMDFKSAIRYVRNFI